MPALHQHGAPGASGTHRRRRLWDGSLPEALGLGFIAIIFGGFVAAYLMLSAAWQRSAAAVAQAEAETLAQAVATALGPLAQPEDRRGAELLKELARLPRIRGVRWTSPAGEVRFAWPLAAAPTTGPTGVVPGPAGEGRSGPTATVAATTVRTSAGESAGTLRIETSVPGARTDQTTLIWNWALAAGGTLLVFALVYRRLRRRLRAVGAVERNLQCYADGLEKELATLTLSGSLGVVARGWNRLIEQLAELQQQLQHARVAGPAPDVLARFESTTFRRIVERLPLGVLCLGEDGGISYANAAAGALLGRSPDDLLGQPIGAAVGDPAVTPALLGHSGRSGAEMVVEHTRQEGDREATLRFRMRPIAERQAGGEALVTVEDIGHLREEQRARDNFLYHVTHELRTPLTNIQAYTETLTKPGFDDEQTRKECYNVIVSETRRLSSLVEDILSISQLEVGTARLDAGDVDLARLMRQMVQDHLGAADGKRIDLKLMLPPKVPKLHGDKQRLAVLLNNLIGNAIKYTPEGGRVQVALEVTEQRILIAVSDTGIGIAAADQAHVFEKFYRAADEAVQMINGSGLGLAIAREVARLHGGEIRLQSEHGKGSTFTVDLPLPATDRAEVTAR